MEKREPKKTDQEQTERGFNLIMEIMSAHPEIEPTLWAGAVWSVLVNGYNQSGVTYDEFTRQWDEVKHHYKSRFDR